jgi:hypothetical protein
MLRRILAIAASVCFAAVAHAQVQISANGNTVLILSAAGTTLADGDAIRVGFIPTADMSLFQTSNSYSTLSQDFEAIGEGNSGGGTLVESPTPSGIYMDINGATTNTNDTTPGGFLATFSNVSLSYDNLSGDPLYLWVFNNANPALATQWGIYGGGSTWDFPTSTFPGVANLSTSSANATPVRGSMLTSGGNSGDFELATIPVPEPDSLSLLAGAGAIAGLAWRRRK